MAGYSEKSLKDKLGIKPGSSVCILNSPPKYEEILGVSGFQSELIHQFDFIQFFTKDREHLETIFPLLKSHLQNTGLLWISWPKVSSRVTTDINENIVREIGLK